MDPELQLITHDVSQAYVQSDTHTQRPIFVRPPVALNFHTDTLLRIDRPLYGIPEAGLHWFRTYHTHHRDKLRLNSSTHDPCFLFTRDGMSHDHRSCKAARGSTCIHVSKRMTPQAQETRNSSNVKRNITNGLTANDPSSSPKAAVYPSMVLRPPFATTNKP